MNPLVSILIPVYNREYIVSETIECALKQTYSNIEIIIVDNFSTDATLGILQNFARKDSRIKIFQNTENVGPVLNWKRCIEEATGEYSKILFSDDLIDSNFIENAINIFDIDTAFVLTEIEVFKEERITYNSVYQHKNLYTTKEYLEDVLLYDLLKFPVSPGCALFRTKDLIKALVIEIANPLSLNFKKFGAGNDLLLFLNTAKNYKNIKIANDTKSYFRSHDGSFTISNDLICYYNYSKSYFIENNYPELMGKFKTSLLVKSINQNRKSEVLKLLKGNYNFYFLFKMLIGKIFNSK